MALPGHARHLAAEEKHQHEAWEQREETQAQGDDTEAAAVAALSLLLHNKVHKGEEAHEQGACKPCIFALRGTCHFTQDVCRYCHANGHVKRLRPSKRQRQKESEKQEQTEATRRPSGEGGEAGAASPTASAKEESRLQEQQQKHAAEGDARSAHEGEEKEEEDSAAAVRPKEGKKVPKEAAAAMVLPAAGPAKGVAGIPPPQKAKAGNKEASRQLKEKERRKQLLSSAATAFTPAVRVPPDALESTGMPAINGWWLDEMGSCRRLFATVDPWASQSWGDATTEFVYGMNHEEAWIPCEAGLWATATAPRADRKETEAPGKVVSHTKPWARSQHDDSGSVSFLASSHDAPSPDAVEVPVTSLQGAGPRRKGSLPKEEDAEEAAIRLGRERTKWE